MADKTRTVAIDAEVLAGKRFAYQEDMSLVDDVDNGNRGAGDSPEALYLVDLSVDTPDRDGLRICRTYLE